MKDMVAKTTSNDVTSFVNLNSFRSGPGGDAHAVSERHRHLDGQQPVSWSGEYSASRESQVGMSQHYPAATDSLDVSCVVRRGLSDGPDVSADEDQTSVKEVLQPGPGTTATETVIVTRRFLVLQQGPEPVEDKSRPQRECGLEIL